MRLAQIDCSRIRFLPGDRVIVKVNCVLDDQDRRKILTAVQRWAGSDVEVLVVELPKFDLEIVRTANKI